MFRHADHCLHNHPHNASNRQFRQFYISYLPLYFRPQLSQRFIPIYLYTLGYDVAAIGLFYVSTTPSGFTTIPAAWLVLGTLQVLNVPRGARWPATGVSSIVIVFAL